MQFIDCSCFLPFFCSFFTRTAGVGVRGSPADLLSASWTCPPPLSDTFLDLSCQKKQKSGLPGIWPFAKMPGSNWHSDGSHGMFNERVRSLLSSSQDVVAKAGIQGVFQISTCVFVCALRALRFCIGQPNKTC